MIIIIYFNLKNPQILVFIKESKVILTFKVCKIYLYTLLKIWPGALKSIYIPFITVH